VKKSLLVALLPVLVLGVVAAAPLPIGPALEKQRALATTRPDDAGVQNDLGTLLVLAGRLDEAEKVYRRAIELAPKSAAAHFNLGLLYLQRQASFSALRQFEKATSLDPRHAWAHYQIGNIYAGWGVKGLAIHSYARALALEPRLADPKYNPQIIDNPLATRAMLYSYRSYRAEATAPASFADPARVAQLLLYSDVKPNPTPAPAPTETAAKTLTVPPGAAKGASAATAAKGAAADPAAKNTEGGAYWEIKVLDAKSLEQSGSSGQVQGGERAAPGRISRRGRMGGAPAYAPATDESAGDSQPSPDPLAGQQPSAIVPIGAYLPGHASTGRLELEIQPLSAAAPAG